jgi:hypothetical protein
MGPETIDYARQRYDHRHRVLEGPISIGLCAIVVIAALRHWAINVHPILIFCIAAAIAVSLIRAAIIVAGGNWECRIEAGVVSWRTSRTGWIQFQIADLAEVVVVGFPNVERIHGYELVMKNGERVVFNWRLVDPDFRSFKAAIQAESRAVKFSSRNGTLCYRCGTNLRVRRDRCPDCGMAIPR